MNIQIKFLLTLTCLFWGINASSGRIASTTPSSVTINISGEDGLPCNEPAPVNYHVTEIFTDQIRFAWNAPVSNPFEYNIKVFETSSGNLVQNFNIAGTHTMYRTQVLQPGTEYTIRNTPVCPDGTLSTQYGEIKATTLIIDLVANGFTGNTTIQDYCSFNTAQQYCLADPDPYNVVTFRVKQLNPVRYRYFGVYKVDANCERATILVNSSEGSPFSFHCSNDDALPNCSNTVAFKIKYGGTEVAVIGSKKLQDGTKALYCISFAGSENYIVERLSYSQGNAQSNEALCGGNFKNPNPGDRSFEGWEEISTPSLSANPNPFSNQLDIQVPFANINENTELNLYDLQGRRVMTMRAPGDQQTITLNTESLSPGMYFLRAESGGIVQTVKVVKTQ